MYYNRHWLINLVAGAGIGIRSAKAGNWLFATVNNKSNPNKNAAFIPYYDEKKIAIGYVSSF